jgi:hypothetical protein
MKTLFSFGILIATLLPCFAMGRRLDLLRVVRQQLNKAAQQKTRPSIRTMQDDIDDENHDEAEL